MRRAKDWTTALPKTFAAFAIAALLIAPTSAKDPKAEQIVHTALVCESLMDDPSGVLAALNEMGWKDQTPGGMGRVTGSFMFRAKNGSAMVGVPGSITGANCQFDFDKVNEAEAQNITAALSVRLGHPPTEEQAASVWKTENGSLGMLNRKKNQITLLWLPKSESN
ncbi:MAG: hypothetical protein AAF559_09765 [Pseudomonadota bacterium]